MIYLKMADEEDDFHYCSAENFNWSEIRVPWSDMDEIESPIPVGPPSDEYRPPDSDFLQHPSRVLSLSEYAIETSNIVIDEVVPVPSTPDQEVEPSTLDQEVVPFTLDHEVVTSTLDHEVVPSTLDHEVVPYTLDQEVVPSTLDHGVVLSTLDHEVVPSILDHEVVTSTPVRPPSLLSINTADIFQDLQMSLVESDFIETSVEDESHFRENESEDELDIDVDTGIWEALEDVAHLENDVEVKNGTENSTNLENKTEDLPHSFEDDSSFAADNYDAAEANVRVDTRMDDEAQSTALSLRSSMGNAYDFDGTDPDDLGLIGGSYSYRDEDFDAEAEVQPHIQKITVEKGSVYTALSALYQQKEYRSLLLEEINYVFKNEPGEGPGPTKQALTLYHIEGRDMLYEGDSECIPRTSAGDPSEALGVMLYQTFMFTGGFPPFICKSFIFTLLTGESIQLYDEECFIKSYINYALNSNDDKLVLLLAVRDGLQSMSSKTKSKLFEVISREKDIKIQQNIAPDYFNDSVDETNWRQVVIDLARLDINEKPSCKSVAKEFQLCMGELYSVSEAKDIINKMNPTSKSIIALLKTQESPLVLTQEMKQVYSYLHKFIMYHCDEPKMAERFMMYCTASTNLPFEPIVIGFNAASGLERGVAAYTCVNMIELPTTYEFYEDFKNEFIEILANNESFEFTSA